MKKLVLLFLLLILCAACKNEKDLPKAYQYTLTYSIAEGGNMVTKSFEFWSPYDRDAYGKYPNPKVIKTKDVYVLYIFGDSYAEHQLRGIAESEIPIHIMDFRKTKNIYKPVER